MKYPKKTIVGSVLALSLFLTACSDTSKTKVADNPATTSTNAPTEKPTPTPPDDPYPFINYGLSFKELKKQLGGKPDKKEKNGAMIDYTYNDTEYYGYKGKSVYHFSSDGSTLMYSEFQTTASSVEEGQEIYDTISKNITKLYGEGAIADSDKTGMTTWEYYGNTTTMSYDFTKKKKCKIVVTNVKSGEDAAV